MDKEDVVHIDKGILLSHKKETNDAISSNKDGPTDYQTKWSESEWERQIPYDITYMWNLKYDANEPIYETESWAYRTDLQLPKRGELGKGIEWEVWVSRCKFFIYRMGKQQGLTV